LLSPSGFLKHLRMGLVCMPHPVLTTQTKPWGFIKLSVKIYTVHMELGLRLTFQLRCDLRGYTMGTTTGFLVITMDALAPWPHLRNPQRHLQYHMSTYSAFHRVNISGHPLNGRLGGYYRGLVLRVTGYSLEIWIRWVPSSGK
jgi:hypothetical protein